MKQTSSNSKHWFQVKIFMWFILLCLPLHAQKSYEGDGPDDILRYVPLTAALTLKVCGVESSSSWKRFVVNAALSEAFSLGTTFGLKAAIHERRPDWTDHHSFPSGHTTMAFSGAVILDKEFRQVSPWISVAGYGVATFVAVDRVVRHRHHWHDVAAGAAIGAGGTLLGYWLGDKLTGEKSRYYVRATSDGVVLAIRL
jgi:membrane-associated phospholipid phosphatase